MPRCFKISKVNANFNLLRWLVNYRGITFETFGSIHANYEIQFCLGLTVKRWRCVELCKKNVRKATVLNDDFIIQQWGRFQDVWKTKKTLNTLRLPKLHTMIFRYMETVHSVIRREYQYWFFLWKKQSYSKQYPRDWLVSSHNLSIIKCGIRIYFEVNQYLKQQLTATIYLYIYRTCFIISLGSTDPRSTIAHMKHIPDFSARGFQLSTCLSAKYDIECWT